MKIWIKYSKIYRISFLERNDYKMGILDINDNFTKKIYSDLEAANVDQYINGVKEHEQPLVIFADKGNDVIYREQL